jgi:hypothetical protein
VTESQSNFALESQAVSRRICQELEDHQTKKRCTGIAHHFLVGKVLGHLFVRYCWHRD